MVFPENVLTIVAEEAANHPQDVNKAITRAKTRIKKLSNSQEIMETLLLQAIQELIYDARHKNNIRIRNQSQEFIKETKVSATGKANKKADKQYFALYAYNLGGTVLGKLTLDDLDKIISESSATAKTHTFHVHLLTGIQHLLSPGKCVDEHIHPKQLQTLWNKSRKAAGL